MDNTNRLRNDVCEAEVSRVSSRSITYNNDHESIRACKSLKAITRFQGLAHNQSFIGSGRLDMYSAVQYGTVVISLKAAGERRRRICY